MHCAGAGNVRAVRYARLNVLTSLYVKRTANSGQGENSTMYCGLGLDVLESALLNAELPAILHCSWRETPLEAISSPQEATRQ